MEKEYTILACCAVFAITIIAGIFLTIWKRRKRVQKPLNRRQRRAQEFANKSEEEMRERRHKGQKEAFRLFQHTIAQYHQQAIREHHSVHKFTMFMLGLAEVQILSYAGQCRKKNLLDQYMGPYNNLVMLVISSEIIRYSNGNGYEYISFELSKFVEKHFQITALRSIIQRDKGRVHYDERCIAMARSILEYFSLDQGTTIDECTLPIDFHDVEQLFTWDQVRKDFYRKVIDQSYNKMMRAADRINYDLKTKRENQVHVDNQRQRAKRIAKRGRKRYA